MVKNFFLIYLFIYFILFTPFSRFTILLFLGPSLPASPAPRKAEALFLLEGCFFVPPAIKVWLCWLVDWSVCKACLPISCVCHGTIGGATDVATRMSPFPQLSFLQRSLIISSRCSDSRPFSFSFLFLSPFFFLMSERNIIANIALVNSR